MYTLQNLALTIKIIIQIIIFIFFMFFEPMICKDIKKCKIENMKIIYSIKDKNNNLITKSTFINNAHIKMRCISGLLFTKLICTFIFLYEYKKSYFTTNNDDNFDEQ